MKKFLIIVRNVLILVFLVGLGLQFYFSKLWMGKLSFPGVKGSFTYEEIPKIVEAKRRALLRIKEPRRWEAVKTFWMEFLEKVIFPAWRGTLWGFYGTAEKPHPGILLTNPLVPQRKKMACGVFVGTVLRDMGFVVNRLKLGQLSSSRIIDVLVKDPSLKGWYSNISFSRFSNEIKRRGKGIYILGLDHHVGLILYNDRGLFFIHSSGRFPYCVVKERLFLSRSVRFSKVKIIGKFSDSRRLIRKWLLRQRVY